MVVCQKLDMLGCHFVASGRMRKHSIAGGWIRLNGSRHAGVDFFDGDRRAHEGSLLRIGDMAMLSRYEMR